MKNKIIALAFLLVVYIPAMLVVAQEAFGIKLPAGSSDPLALTAGAGLITISPMVIIRLFRSN